MPLHLYTVMSRIPALIATHANRWFIVGGSEEKIKINTDLQLYIHVDMPFFFLFFFGITGYMKVHVAYIYCIHVSICHIYRY